MNNGFDILFEPLTVRGFTLRNRVVMPPMVVLRGHTSPEALQWYGDRAAGGVGMVIVEATPVEEIGRELSADRLRKLVDAIHAGGALAAIQIFPGYLRDRVVPADLAPGRIAQFVELYERAARVCAEAGFDGAEPHGAHGYLLNKFFSPTRNSRTDEYGGPLENRMRWGLQIAEAMREGLGSDRLLLYRHTPVKEGDYPVDDSLVFARELVRRGVDILDISPACAETPGDLAVPFRELGVPVIAVGEMDEPDRAAEVLAEARADLVAIGRGLIADPEWPHKVLEGRLDHIVRCVRCNAKCFGHLPKGLPVECTQW